MSIMIKEDCNSILAKELEKAFILNKKLTNE